MGNVMGGRGGKVGEERRRKGKWEWDEGPAGRHVARGPALAKDGPAHASAKLTQ